MIAVTMAVLMAGVGTTLEVGDFRRVVARPRAALVGWTCQVLCLPLLAFAIAEIAGLPAATAAGLVLIAACPGGVFSNLMTLLAKGDVALSVTLTAASTTTALVTLPLWLRAALARHPVAEIAPLPLGGAVVGVALMTVVPVAVGMLVRARAPAFVARVRRPFDLGSLAFLVGFLAFVAWGQRDQVAAHLGQTVPAVLALNVVTLGAGLLAGLAARLDRPAVIAVAMEAAVQNAALGMTVATVFLGSTALATPAALYGLFTLVTSLGVIAVGRWR